MHKNKENLTGFVFGRWTVLCDCASKKGHSAWNCRCECGREEEVLACNLKKETSKGCMSCRAERMKTHNMSNSKTYSIWVQMIERCHNEKHRFYKWYGARGIKVSVKWRNDFKWFLEDMGEKPEGLSLDRIDNDKGYGKHNCKWSTKTEQQRNRRNSINIGEVHENWIIKSRIDGQKKYIINCIHCNRERIISSCNFRKAHPCKCKEE